MGKRKPKNSKKKELTVEELREVLDATFSGAQSMGVSYGGVRNADYYAEIERYKFISSSDEFVCTGKSFGSYNYERVDKVFPPSQRLIPIKNRFGGVDYKLNPNYKKK